MKHLEFHAPAGSRRLPVRILADDPVMGQMLTALLEPYCIITEESAVLTVLCPDDGKMPSLPNRGRFLIICDEPYAQATDRISVLSRPLDLEQFLETVFSLCAQEEYHGAADAREYWCNDKNRTVTYNGNTVSLTDKEYALFQILLDSIGEIVSKQKLTQLLWNEGNNNACQVYMAYLRGKLERIAGPGVLVSVRGKGYMLRRP